MSTKLGVGMAAVLVIVIGVVLRPAPTKKSGPKLQVQAQTRKLPVLFPKSKAWSQPVPTEAQTQANSQQLVAYLSRQLDEGPDEAPFIALRTYGVPVFVGRRSDPVERLRRCYSYACPGVGGRRIHVPAAAQPDPGTDGHMAILDPERGKEFDFFRARRTNGRWEGAGGAVVNYRTGSGSTGKRTGATAAHTALLAGLILPEEIKRGRIEHALAVTIPGIGAGPPRCPAVFNVPTTDDPDAPPEGTRYQLDQDVDVANLKSPRLDRIIARALQDYGMIVVDNGGVIAFRAQNPLGSKPDAWAKLGYPNVDSVSLKGLPLDQMRVVAAESC